MRFANVLVFATAASAAAVGKVATSSHWTRLVITDSCVFGVKSASAAYPRIGSLDIADITRDAINMYKTTGSPSRIGAEGNMGCNVQITGFSGLASVNWAIFHN
ncbi:hypothetical protein QBC38DRAFT_524929 [Podospora fimiseda]|uniref:Ecp2 effector protein-like domain-containing protein n=1 Tax=Podospora fimiseda TaxID=252190 RepID=A0AAN6YLK1_9PEZI|nr:hypothetical protein QBC38DRAFT_524929 [Podospora fimiseda]